MGSTANTTLANRFGLSVQVRASEGTYTMLYEGKPWLGPGIVSALVNDRWYHSAAISDPQGKLYKSAPGRLVLNGSSGGTASDQLGAYDFVDLTWIIPESGTRLVTGFRLYHERPILVFRQAFPDGFKGYASGDWTTPSVVFPQFLPGVDTASKELYSWVSGGLDTHRFAYGPASSLGGTVDVLLLSDETYRTVVLSPFSNYLVATQQSKPVATEGETQPTKAAINCGIEGLIDELPPGFEHSNILVAGTGVTRTLREWGGVLLQKAGKPIPSKYTGDAMKYPTYWDDYGAYYREHGFKEQGYRSYEDIILGVAKEAKAHGLHIGAYQVQDSDQMRFRQGLFEPRADLLPHGLRWLHEKLGAPLEAYTSWIASEGPYRQKYPYFETPKADILGYPAGSMGDVFYTEKYWEDTADKLASWGATQLQQDYLSAYDGNPVMMASLTRMNAYLKNQAKSLSRRGMTMQYCMTLPRNILESTENPIVVSLQGGSDHHVHTAEPNPTHTDEDPYMWKQMTFGSALYSAVGLWPSRDNIQSVADPNALEDMLFANLLGGEIQLGHRIGEADFALIARTYREGDDLILKPDRPIVPLDRCYHEACAVGYTQSAKDGKDWFYILSFPSSGYPPTFSLSEVGATGNWVLYDFDLQSPSVLQATTPVLLRSTGKHQYLIAAPLFENGMAVIGDASKFVTMADKRVPSVSLAGGGLRVEVVSDQVANPVITGYSDRLPSGAVVGQVALAEASSLKRLQAASSGWFWDPQTKLWYVKVDFGDAKSMTTKTFTIM
jgi:hypothetical protein